MNTVFTEILNMSITASFMIAAILIIRPLTGKVSKNINCILWALAGLRLVLPFSFKTKVSAVPDIQVLAPQTIPDMTPEVIPDVVPTLPSEPIVQTNSIDILSVLWIVWLVGIVLLSVYTLVSFVLIKKKTAISLHENDNIYICDNIKGAFILGSFKPRIYIPSNTPADQKQYVIAHENAHIKRLDYLWKPLGLFVAILHWFNPLVWVGYILLCRDIELACDEAVTRNMTVDSKKSYTRALLECAVAGNRYRPSPLAFGEVGVKDRIKSILNYRKPAFWVSFGVMAVCVIVTVVFMTDPVINAKIPDPLPEVVVKDTEEIENPESDETEELPEDTDPVETEPKETDPVETESVESDTTVEDTTAENTTTEDTTTADTSTADTTTAKETKPKETEKVTEAPKPDKETQAPAKKISITYKSADGTTLSVKEAKSGEYTQLYKASVSGFDVVGWTTQKGSNKTEYAITSYQSFTNDTTLYAVQMYRITYDAQGGSCEKAQDYLYYGQGPDYLPFPSRDGYKFEGWRDNNNTRLRVNQINTTAGHQTLTAAWFKESLYRVMFITNGGSCNVNYILAEYGKPIGSLPVPARESYSFAGWFWEDPRTGEVIPINENSLMPFDADIAIEAKWIEN